MAVCPKCQTPLKEDFGLETCTGCGVVVFVNDDKVSLQEDEDNFVPETEPENSFIEGTSVDEDLDEDLIDTSDEPMEEKTPESVNETEFDDPLLFGELSEESEDMTPPGLDHLKQPSHEPLETDLESLFEGDLDNSEDAHLDQEEVASSKLSTESDNDDESEDETLIPTSADDFLEEMQLFGEMDSEKFQDAIYFFDIEIASIDSKDIRDEILGILDDPKLNLKIEKPNQKIKNGVLLLAAVPAVKAFIIVQRISHLPCELSWALVEVHDLGEEAEAELDAEAIPGNETDFGIDSSDEI